MLAQCEVDTYRASGPGGQKRNKTSSAVRLRHPPTGLLVIAEESRSQHANKAKALKRLRRALWADLRAGRIHTIGSDHSPALPEMKDSANLFAVWGGIAGVQHGSELLLSECAATAEKDLPLLAAVLARNVARRFRLDLRKGSLATGFDADFSLVRFDDRARVIEADDLWTRHRMSPYVGRRSRARVTHTYVRGSAVLADGRLTNLPQRGQFLAPHR